jgi:hypothetical protein
VLKTLDEALAPLIPDKRPKNIDDILQHVGQLDRERLTEVGAKVSKALTQIEWPF